MVVDLLPPHEVLAQMEHIAPLIARGLDRGGGSSRVSVADLMIDALQGEALVWVAPDMACLAKEARYPTGIRTLYVISVGGKNMHAWLPDLIEKLKLAATNLGITEIEFMGRFGWNRVLSRYGWRPASIHMTLGV